MTYRSPSFEEPENPVGTVAELFAGVGGFRIGLAQAGWKTVFSNQWEPSTKAQHASDVYVRHFGHVGHSNEDIASVGALPPDVDLVVGGFPCQDYSVAKSAQSATGLVGKKGVLWWEILRLLMINSPRFVILENVDRLLKSPSIQPGRDFAVMLSTLSNAGYDVEWRVINAADYGEPQRRKRVFIFAAKTDVFDFGDSEGVIFENGILARAFPVLGNSSGVETLQLSESTEEVSNLFNREKSRSPFGNGGSMTRGRVSASSVDAKYDGHRRTLGDVVLDEDSVGANFWISPEELPKWTYQKGAKRIPRQSKPAGFSYLYSEGSMGFPDSLEKPSRTVLTAEGGSSASRFKHVIRQGSRFRRLTPLELERLFGFPDDWTSSGFSLGQISDGKRAFLMGNALVTNLVARIGAALESRLV